MAPRSAVMCLCRYRAGFTLNGVFIPAVFPSVSPHSTTVRFLAALVFIAMGAAQLFGVQRGYVCDCGGTSEIVDAPYCVGPHGEECHSHEHDSQLAHNEQGERKDHDALTDNLQSSPAPVVTVSVPPPVMLFTLPDFLFLPAPVALSATQYHAGESGAPPPGVALERTVVFLI